MRILQLDKNSAKDIQQVIKFAQENVWDKFKIESHIAGDILAPGMIPDHMLYLHDGFRVVYTLEQHCVLCHHMSISIEAKNEKELYPNILAVQMIMEAFGMSKNFDDCLGIWEEKEEHAINILQEVGVK